jgi:hypothetical protein
MYLTAQMDTSRTFVASLMLTSIYILALTRSVQHSSISSAGAIEAIHLTGGNIQEMNEDVSKVVYTRKSGQQLEFLPALKAVVQYWNQKFL